MSTPPRSGPQWNTHASTKLHNWNMMYHTGIHDLQGVAYTPVDQHRVSKPDKKHVILGGKPIP